MVGSAVPEKLEAICADLDVSVAEENWYCEIQVNWRLGKTKALKGAHAEGWVHMLNLTGAKIVTSQILYHLEMVLKHEAKHS